MLTASLVPHTDLLLEPILTGDDSVADALIFSPSLLVRQLVVQCPDYRRCCRRRRRRRRSLGSEWLFCAAC